MQGSHDCFIEATTNLPVRTGLLVEASHPMFANFTSKGRTARSFGGLRMTAGGDSFANTG